MKYSKLVKMMVAMSLSIMTIGISTGCGSTQNVSNGENTEVSAGAATEDHYIIMGTNAEFEPFEYHDGLDVVGFDIEIAQAVAEHLGKELKVDEMAFDSLIMSLNNDQIDFIAAGMTATKERAQQVDFSDHYFTSKQMIIVKADDNSIKTADDLVGKKVGVQLGTTGDLFVSETKGVEVISFKKAALAVMDLENDKVDAVVIDAEPAKKLIAGKDDLKIVEAPFIEEEYAIAVKKGNTELKDAINETIAELKANGTYDEIYAKYFDAAQ